MGCQRVERQLFQVVSFDKVAILEARSKEIEHVRSPKHLFAWEDPSVQNLFFAVQASRGHCTCVCELVTVGRSELDAPIPLGMQEIWMQQVGMDCQSLGTSCSCCVKDVHAATEGARGCQPFACTMVDETIT